MCRVGRRGKGRGLLGPMLLIHAGQTAVYHSLLVLLMGKAA